MRQCEVAINTKVCQNTQNVLISVEAMFWYLSYSTSLLTYHLHVSSFLADVNNCLSLQHMSGSLESSIHIKTIGYINCIKKILLILCCVVRMRMRMRNITLTGRRMWSSQTFIFSLWGKKKSPQTNKEDGEEIKQNKSYSSQDHSRKKPQIQPFSPTYITQGPALSV